MKEKSRLEKIKKLVQKLSKDLEEREEVIAPTLLASLINESIFFYGPPGTGKSLIARRMSEIFSDQNYFEYLLHKFTTPDEIFGPVSISELKKDNYKRLTEGFLPTATFAFLDEIWKSSPSILNTLLTILNERIFKNGSVMEEVPLRTIVSASNEIPQKKQGLEALYDRFLLRIMISPIIKKDNFKNLIDKNCTRNIISIPKDLKVSPADMKKWNKEIREVKLSKEAINIIWSLRNILQEKVEELDIYISDRRWEKISYLLKASAYFCERRETNLSDLLLLKYCLWSTEENKKEIDEIVENTIKNNAFSFEKSLSLFDRKKDNLDREIKEELFYNGDIYKTKTLKNKEYFYTYREIKTGHSFMDTYNEHFYIDLDYIKKDEVFSPIDKDGNLLDKKVRCNFKGTGICEIEVYNPYHYRWETRNPYIPSVLYNKGDKKEDVNKRLIKDLNKSSVELIEECEKMLEEINSYYKVLKKDIDNPFITEKDTEILLAGVKEIKNEIELKKFDCERIKGLTEK
ncbi:MAG: AAA family ATPase [Fusobacterium sp.]|nr:AAA family ATPase [Fusobacterium sp.]